MVLTFRWSQTWTNPDPQICPRPHAKPYGKDTITRGKSGVQVLGHISGSGGSKSGGQKGVKKGVKRGVKTGVKRGGQKGGKSTPKSGPAPDPKSGPHQILTPIMLGGTPLF